MEQTDPHVAVIGTGISGLTAGKMLKDYGVRYTTFETSDRIGGNWAFGNPNGHSSAYRSLHIDTSKHRGEAGALALAGAYDSYTALAGPTWRNEIDCAIGLEVVGIRTTAAAKKLRCPLLVQIADFDQYVPANAVAATAAHGRAQVHHYPCDHFDVWPGNDWFDKTAADQIAFLSRTLLTQ